MHQYILEIKKTLSKSNVSLLGIHLHCLGVQLDTESTLKICHANNTI